MKRLLDTSSSLLEFDELRVTSKTSKIFSIIDYGIYLDYCYLNFVSERIFRLLSIVFKQASNQAKQNINNKNMAQSYPVRLRCYDLSQGMAAQFAPMFGLQLEAIWHTGLEYQGVEYFFSGGIRAQPPQRVETTFGMRPTKVLELGNTTKSKQELQSFLNSISHRFTANTYDLFNHNCNHFTGTCTY